MDKKAALAVTAFCRILFFCVSVSTVGGLAGIAHDLRLALSVLATLTVIMTPVL
jgi:hypothetical protein